MSTSELSNLEQVKANQKYLAFLNGELVDDIKMANLAFSGFAHFTALQVRDRKVRGLDLHLARLRAASIKLYGQALSDEVIMTQLRQALAGASKDVSVMITIYAPEGEFTAASMDSLPEILVRIAPPEDGPVGPLRVSTVGYERALAEVKHVGEIAKTYYLHEAVKQGYDDAVFINGQGHVSEGTIWNVAFWDGEAVVWAKASLLQGTMMSMLQRQLETMGVPQRYEEMTLDKVMAMQGMAVMNSWRAGIAVSEIGLAGWDKDVMYALQTAAAEVEHIITDADRTGVEKNKIQKRAASKRYTGSEELVALLHRAYAAEPAQEV